MTTFFDNTMIDLWQAKEWKDLASAFDCSRKWRTVTGIDRHRTERSQTNTLLAVNSFSRLLWNRAICHQLSDFFCDGGDGSAHTGEIFWVTLCDQLCVRSRNDRLSDDDLTWIKTRLRRALIGTSYFAVLEPAYYTDWKFGYGAGQNRQCVSWHLHALVWGITAKELRKRIRRLKKAGFYVALGRGLRPTHVAAIKPGELPTKVGYLLKSPCSAYRVSVEDEADICGRPLHDQDGVVLRGFSQRKAELRPGERLTIFRFMRDLRLNDLAMAGGAGSGILAATKRDVERTCNPPWRSTIWLKGRPKHNTPHRTRSHANQKRVRK